MGRMRAGAVNCALGEDPNQMKRKSTGSLSTSPEKMDISSLIDMDKNRMGSQEEKERDKMVRHQMSIDHLQLDRERFDLEKTEREECMATARERNAQQAEM